MNSTNHRPRSALRIDSATVAGYLLIAPGYRVAMADKPSRLHRLAIRLLLGWKWEDAE